MEKEFSSEYEIGECFAIIAETRFELIKKISKKLSKTEETDDLIATIMERS